MTRRKPDLTFADLLAMVPQAPDWRVDWSVIWPAVPLLAPLDICPQDKIHHAEGDVGIHTRMVVEALVADPVWRGLDEATATEPVLGRHLS